MTSTSKTETDPTIRSPRQIYYEQLQEAHEQKRGVKIVTQSDYHSHVVGFVHRLRKDEAKVIDDPDKD